MLRWTVCLFSILFSAGVMTGCASFGTVSNQNKLVDDGLREFSAFRVEDGAEMKKSPSRLRFQAAAPALLRSRTGY